MAELKECFRLEGPGGNDPLFIGVSHGDLRVSKPGEISIHSKGNCRRGAVYVLLYDCHCWR